MLKKLGQKFTDLFQRFMPDAFVFAIILTLIVSLGAYFVGGSSFLEIISAWYKGFWSLLEFGMQIVLMLVTGASIALSPFISKSIDRFTSWISSPNLVYIIVVTIGTLLATISFGWVVITCVLARELALRVKGVNYPFLIACVYFSFGSWVTGLSSSIPLLLNTENNYLITGNVLSSTIATSQTLGSGLNLAMIALFVIGAPLLLLLLAPKAENQDEITYLLNDNGPASTDTIKDEAKSYELPRKSLSDFLNRNVFLQMTIVVMGLSYITYHFYAKGFDLNFNIMIFIFLIFGMLLHKTPMRYGISMKRASNNISGILFQYPFYAGIMGIMLHTGLGESLAGQLASIMTIDNYAFIAYLTGGIVNFAIPSAGGEFAVIGPSIIGALQETGSHLSPAQLENMISRASISLAYGESLSNLLQPFFLLLVLPIMGSGIKIQARDVMGYLVLPFLVFFIIQSAMVVWWP